MPWRMKEGLWQITDSVVTDDSIEGASSELKFE